MSFAKPTLGVVEFGDVIDMLNNLEVIKNQETDRIVSVKNAEIEKLLEENRKLRKVLSVIMKNLGVQVGD